jgi:hypothetical protein
MPLKHGGRDEQGTQGATDEDRTTTWTIYGAPGQWTVYRENGSLMGTYPTMQQIEHLADQHAAALTFPASGVVMTNCRLSDD